MRKTHNFKIYGNIPNYHPVILTSDCPFEIKIDNFGNFSFITAKLTVSIVYKWAINKEFTQMTYLTIFGSDLVYNITDIEEYDN